jgi:hypothetical protein
MAWSVLLATPPSRRRRLIDAALAAKRSLSPGSGMPGA